MGIFTFMQLKALIDKNKKPVNTFTVSEKQEGFQLFGDGLESGANMNKTDDDQNSDMEWKRQAQQNARDMQWTQKQNITHTKDLFVQVNGNINY